MTTTIEVKCDLAAESDLPCSGPATPAKNRLNLCDQHVLERNASRSCDIYGIPPRYASHVARLLEDHRCGHCTTGAAAAPTVADLLGRLAETLTALDRLGVGADQNTTIETAYAEVGRYSGDWVVVYHDEESAQRVRECHDLDCGYANQNAIHVDH